MIGAHNTLVAMSMPSIGSVWLNKDSELVIVFHHCKHAENHDLLIAYRICGQPELFITSIGEWHKNFVQYQRNNKGLGHG